MSDQTSLIPDPVLTPEDLSRTIQKAVDGVDDLYARISNPLARDHLKREGIKDFLALIAVSHAELQDRVAMLAADVERLLQEAAAAPITDAKPEGQESFVTSPESEIETGTPLPDGFVSDRVVALLRGAGYTTIEAVDNATDDELLAIDGIGPSYLEDIQLELLALTDEAVGNG